MRRHAAEIADGFSLVDVAPSGVVTRPMFVHTAGFPGFVVHVASGRGEVVLATSSGRITRSTGEDRIDELAATGSTIGGICRLPDGDVLYTDFYAGELIRITASGKPRRITTGLRRPTGVASNAFGDVFVSESGAGQVSLCTDRTVTAMITRLHEPHGVTVRPGRRDPLRPRPRHRLSPPLRARFHRQPGRSCLGWPPGPSRAGRRGSCPGSRL